MKWLTVLALCFGCSSPGWTQPEQADPASKTQLRPLFDGETLDGWRQAGGKATYRVEDQCIVGEVGPGPNSFLCTEATYGDFELELEFRMDVTINSGIQIRSHQTDAGGVFGYQCEIDPSERSWTGGIFEEGRRGWLDPLEGDDAARGAFKRDGWNTMRVLAIGPHLRTWVNGIPCADLLDPMDLEGFIALQVHNGSEGQLRWRNVRLRDLGQHRWQPLFDGKTLAGWHARGGGTWTVENGLIRGRSSHDEAAHGHLVSDAVYSDFAIRLKYHAHTGNSGLYFRVAEGDGNPGVLGFQAEIDPEKDAGGLYETGGRGWVVKPSAEDVARWYEPIEWNEMSVIAKGDRIVVHVNGHQTAELKNDPGRRRGHFALQLHGGQDMDIEVKDIEILTLHELETGQ